MINNQLSFQIIEDVSTLKLSTAQLPAITFCVNPPWKNASYGVSFFSLPNLTDICGSNEDYKNCLENATWGIEDIVRLTLKDLQYPLNANWKRATQNLGKYQAFILLFML